MPGPLKFLSADDAEADSDIAFRIVFEATASLDFAYANLIPNDVLAVTLDDEPGLVIDTAGTNLTLRENGGITQFLVALAAPPLHDLT